MGRYGKDMRDCCDTLAQPDVLHGKGCPLTTDPANAPAEQVPTRDEIAWLISRSVALRRAHSNENLEDADAIIALYAPALAKLEREVHRLDEDYRNFVDAHHADNAKLEQERDEARDSRDIMQRAMVAQGMVIRDTEARAEAAEAALATAETERRRLANFVEQQVPQIEARNRMSEELDELRQALATAEAEGMRKAAGIVDGLLQKAGQLEDSGALRTNRIAAFTQAYAAILAAIPK